MTKQQISDNDGRFIRGYEIICMIAKLCPIASAITFPQL